MDAPSPHELWFKLIFVGAFVTLIASALPAAIAAKKRHGGQINQLIYEMKWLLYVRGAFGVVFYGAAFAWLFQSQAPAMMRLPISDGPRWTAAGLLVLVVGLFAWSFRHLGSNHRGGVGLYDNHQLVTTGPYAWTRHPIYAAFIMLMVLVMVLSRNWWLGLSGVLLTSILAAGRIPVEERQLRERFGAEWDRYRSRTRLLF